MTENSRSVQKPRYKLANRLCFSSPHAFFLPSIIYSVHLLQKKVAGITSAANDELENDDEIQVVEMNSPKIARASKGYPTTSRASHHSPQVSRLGNKDRCQDEEVPRFFEIQKREVKLSEFGIVMCYFCSRLHISL